MKYHILAAARVRLRTRSFASNGLTNPSFIGVRQPFCSSSLSFKMHFLKGLVLSLLPITALGAKKPVADKFQQFHTKALSSAPLKLDDSIYGQLTSAPRDYSVAVLLTALESRFGCQLCREFQPEWDLLSKSWTKGDKQGESRLVYGTLDFTDGKNTFQSVRLGILSNLEVTNIYAAWSPNSPSTFAFPTNSWPTCSCGQCPSQI
jgi:OST3 / OST6 family, transporter family